MKVNLLPLFWEIIADSCENRTRQMFVVCGQMQSFLMLKQVADTQMNTVLSETKKWNTKYLKKYKTALMH
jgi:hypothetical protein